MKFLGFLFALMLGANVFAADKVLTCKLTVPQEPTKTVTAKINKQGRYAIAEPYTWSYENQKKTYKFSAEIWKRADGVTLGNLIIQQTGLPDGKEYSNQAINHCEGEPCNTELVVTLDSIGMQAECNFQ